MAVVHAAVARKWGAIWGQGVGLQGQTYAIPTCKVELKRLNHTWMNF